MNMRKTMGGALLLTAASALCTTQTASANCNSVLVYDNGFPNICIVVPSQVIDSTGASPAGADDVTVPLAGMRVTDVHWYTAEPSATGIGYSGNANVLVQPAIASCGGPNDAVAPSYNITAPATRTIVNAGAVSVGGVAHDIVRYDMTKVDFSLIGSSGGTTYWVTCRPVSNGPTAPGDSLWMSTRCEQLGDTIQGCAAFADADTSTAGGWAVIGTAGTSNIDLNFQLTRCDNTPCPWNLQTAGASANVIDTGDLFILLANFGTNGPGADFAAPTNIVNTADLFVLLARFGWQCPATGTNNACGFSTLIAGPGNTSVNLAGATPDGPADGCAGVPNGQGDRWYCWKGECDGFTTITLDFAAGIRVYSGGLQDCGDCGNLGAPIACGANTVRFLSEQGRHFRIRISGTGSGTMNISDCEPFNDECEDAILITTLDGPVSGNLMGFNGDTVPPCSAVDPGGNLGQAPGAWYVAVGTGNTMRASLCPLDGGAGANTRIAVYCGNSCDGFQSSCTLLSGSDLVCGAAPGTQANSTWCSVNGVIYFLLVTMDDNVSTPGPYTIVLLDNGVSCTPTASEASCPGIPGDVCLIDQDTSRGIGSGANCQLPDQMGHGDGGIVGATSDRNPGAGFTVADDFTPAANGNLTTICFWGFYLDFSIPADCAPGDMGGNGDHFRIRILNNNPTTGLPGATVLYNEPDFTPVLNTSKRYTGNDIASGAGPLQEWEYTYTLSSPLALTAGTCYWVEISNNTLANCFWLWSTTGPGNSKSAQDTDLLGYGAGDCNDFDMSFCLNLDLGNIGTACGTGCALFDPVLCTLTGYYQAPANATAYTSDVNINNGTNIVVADNFVAGVTGNINGMCWWGPYLTFAGGFSACATPPTNEGFTINFHTDNAGLPQNPPFATRNVVIGGANRANSGLTLISPVFEFSVSFANVAVTNGTTYWVSVQLNPNQTCEFLWTNSAIGDNVLARSTNGAAWAVGAADDLAFRLNIAATTPGPPPPPANDLCSAAQSVTPNSGSAVAASNLFATPAAGPDPEIPAGSPTCHWSGEPQGYNHTVWYSVVMPAGHTQLRVEACTDINDAQNSMNDSTVTVYTGSCGGLTEVGCGEDECAAGAAPYYSDTGLVSGLTPGSTVRVCVGNPGGTGNADGQGTVLVRFTTTP